MRRSLSLVLAFSVVKHALYCCKREGCIVSLCLATPVLTCPFKTNPLKSWQLLQSDTHFHGNSIVDEYGCRVVVPASQSRIPPTTLPHQKALSLRAYIVRYIYTYIHKILRKFVKAVCIYIFSPCTRHLLNGDRISFHTVYLPACP